MIRSEINQLIIDKVNETDYHQHIKNFVLEILHYESSHYEEIEAGGVPRYSKNYENLLNKHVREQLESSAKDGGA